MRQAINMGAARIQQGCTCAGPLYKAVGDSQQAYHTEQIAYEYKRKNSQMKNSSPVSNTEP